MLEIDGSTGGGQLLRTALSLSMITQKSFKMTDIRSNRKNPGLRPQHLNAIKALTMISDSKTKGAKLNSRTIRFIPGKINKKYLTVDIETAGSTTLLIQTLVPIIIHENKQFKIWLKGGTDTKWSPTSNFLKELFLFNLGKIGIKINLEIESYGFFPKGNGKIILEITESKPKKLNFTKRGELKYGKITSISSYKLRKPKIADRLTKSFLHNSCFPVDFAKEVKYPKTLSTGAVISAFLEFENYRIGSDKVGERGISSEEIGKQCADQLLSSYLKKGLDKYSSDQMLIYLAIFGGKMKVEEVTDHLISNKKVIEQFLDIEIKIKDDLVSV